MTVRRIKITKEIINSALRANSSHCMIADAIRAHMPNANYISVDLQTMRFSLGDERFVYFTPRTAQLALIKFDQGENDIIPFDFALGRPAQVVKRNKQSARPLDDKRKAESAKGGQKTQERARLAKVAAAKKGTTKIGGRLPPTFTVQSNLGNRRVFGLRAARA